MKKFSASLGLALAALASVGSQPLQAQGCDVSYRLWQDGNNTYYKPGQVIFLEVGEQADLYIHGHRSKSPDPYSASADFAAPSDYGVGGQRQRDIDRVLRLGKREPSRGKISFTAIAPGETALGYRITGVFSPGSLDKIPANCRTGQVKITVRGSAPGFAPPPPPTAGPGVGSLNEAAHALIKGLYTGILRRSEAESQDYPDSFFDQVQRSGLQGLISVAETMTSSAEFRNASLDRTRQGLQASGVSTDRLSPALVQDQLLTDISQSLYGRNPDPAARRLLSDKLASCLSGNSNLCRQLGRDLLAQRYYYDHHRDLLQYWRR